MTPEAFVQTYYCLAKEVEKTYGVPWLACLGQAANESAWGKAAPGNNFFGIKAFSNWHGKVQTFSTLDYINGQWIQHHQNFRAYDSVREGWMDYGNYLRNSGLYKNAFAYSNPYQFIQVIGPIYATVFYANFTSGIMQKISAIVQANPPENCGTGAGWAVLGILGFTALGVGIAYKFDGKKIKKDWQEIKQKALKK